MIRQRGAARELSKKRAWGFGLAALAVTALGVSGIALAKSAPGEDATSVSAQPAPAQASAVSSRPGPPKIKLPVDPHVLIVGDSYTAGVGADRPDHGWANFVAGSLGYPTKVDGIPGTGFAWGGGASGKAGQQYLVRLNEAAKDVTFVPDVLILQGGQNDSLLKDDARVGKSVVATVAGARKLWPAVQVLIMGPSAPEPLAADLTGTNAAVRDGAATAGAPFIDAAGEHWFTAQNSTSYYSDGSHVNTAGHELIADRFVAHWRQLFE